MSAFIDDAADKSGDDHGDDETEEDGDDASGLINDDDEDDEFGNGDANAHRELDNMRDDSFEFPGFKRGRPGRFDCIASSSRRRRMDSDSEFENLMEVDGVLDNNTGTSSSGFSNGVDEVDINSGESNVASVPVSSAPINGIESSQSLNNISTSQPVAETAPVEVIGTSSELIVIRVTHIDVFGVFEPPRSGIASTDSFSLANEDHPVDLTGTEQFRSCVANLKGILADFQAIVPDRVRYEAVRTIIQSMPEDCKDNLEQCRINHIDGMKAARTDDQRARIKSLSHRIQLAGHSMRYISIHMTNAWNAIWNEDIVDEPSDVPDTTPKLDEFLSIEEELTHKTYTPFHELLNHVLGLFRSSGRKRQGEDVYERQVNSNGDKTAAWKQSMSILDYIHNNVTKSSCYKLWIVKSKEKDPVPRLVNHLCTSNESEFSDINISRTVFSFENGVYDAEHNLFTPYPLQPESEYFRPGYKSAAKHFPNTLFPEDLWLNTRDDPSRWSDIPTTELDEVFKYQNIPDEAISWFYFSIGRMLYPIGAHDDLQYFLFLEGAAGCGKSTTLKVIQNIYPEYMVGILSNNIETKFGLSSLEDKWICVAPEIKSDWKISVTEFQSMASGESVSIAVKNKKTIQKQWTAQVAMAGNEIPGFDDISGSVSRRLLMFKFYNKPTVENGGLLSDIKRNMGHIILKSNVCYRFRCKTGYNSSLWTHVPEYFTKIRDSVQRSNNILYDYMSQELEKDPQGSIYFETFKFDVKVFSKEKDGSDRTCGNTFDSHKVYSVASMLGFGVVYCTKNGEEDNTKIDRITGCRKIIGTEEPFDRNQSTDDHTGR